MPKRFAFSAILWFWFFFSSRRRHTRSLCDWSSDVCSSDLASRSRSRERGELGIPLWFELRTPPYTGDVRLVSYRRSEERRVGKEGRLRRAAALGKKKRRPRGEPAPDCCKRSLRRRRLPPVA